MSALLRRLERHWFAPAPLSDLALVRIVLAGSQLISLLDSGPSSLRGQLWLSHAPAERFVPLPVLKVLMLPFGPWGTRPDPMFLHAVWLGSVCFAVLAILGLYTRLALLLLAAGSTLLIAHSYSYGETHHAQALRIIALWARVLSPSGRALSVDAVRARVRGAMQFMRFEPVGAEMSDNARWPLRLIQWLLVLSYLSAAAFKLTLGGLDWLNGYTLAYYLVADAVRWGQEYTSVPIGFRTAILIAHFPLLCAMIAAGALLFEATFSVAVLVPRTAWLYVLAGTLMHSGIYFLQRAPFFQFIALYIAFVGPIRETLGARRARRLPSGARRRWTVVYDGLCPLCIRSMVRLDVLDVSDRLAYLDLEHDWPAITERVPSLTREDVRRAMHVIAPDGTVHRGFFAFRELSRAMPMLWPIAPIMYAPLASRVGPILYHRVARGRARLVCTAETCGAGHATMMEAGKAGA